MMSCPDCELTVVDNQTSLDDSYEVIICKVCGSELEETSKPL